MDQAALAHQAFSGRQRERSEGANLVRSVHPCAHRHHPDLPAIAETVPGFEWSGLYGLAAPAGTPRDRIAQILAAQREMLKVAEFCERLAELGADAIGSASQEYTEHLRRQIDKMREAVKVSGLRIE